MRGAPSGERADKPRSGDLENDVEQAKTQQRRQSGFREHSSWARVLFGGGWQSLGHEKHVHILGCNSGDPMKPVSKPRQANPETSWVDDATLRQLMGYHMKGAFNVIQADLAATLKPFDLRMLTYTALVLIKDNPGLRQSQLADAMDIERPNLVVIIDELERRELIVRERVSTDRRAYALQVTMAGRQLCEQAETAVLLHENRLLENLDEETRAVMIAGMHLVEKNGKKG